MKCESVKDNPALPKKLAGLSRIRLGKEKKLGDDIWGFPKMVVQVPPFHTPKSSFLVGTPIVVGENRHFRKPPYNDFL